MYIETKVTIFFFLRTNMTLVKQIFRKFTKINGAILENKFVLTRKFLNVRKLVHFSDKNKRYLQIICYFTPPIAFSRLGNWISYEWSPRHLYAVEVTKRGHQWAWLTSTINKTNSHGVSSLCSRQRRIQKGPFFPKICHLFSLRKESSGYLRNTNMWH